MKAKRLGGKSFKKTILVATMLIGASTLIFQGLIQVVVAGELDKTKTIATSYVNYEKELSQVTQEDLREGYNKANYKVETIDLDIYRNQKVTVNDITREDAAEIGAQALWNVYSVSLDDQVIEMGYNEAVESLPRSNWFGYIKVNDKLSYYFYVDSLTGELFDVGCSRTLDTNVPLGFDSALAKNPQEYIDLVKEFAEEHNVVHGLVKLVEYSSQGYQSNDPDAQFEITGENGECAQINISRYDKALLGISYNAKHKYTLKHIKKIEKEMQIMDEKLKNSDQSSNENQVPTLLKGF